MSVGQLRRGTEREAEVGRTPHQRSHATGLNSVGLAPSSARLQDSKPYISNRKTHDHRRLSKLKGFSGARFSTSRNVSLEEGWPIDARLILGRKRQVTD